MPFDAPTMRTVSGVLRGLLRGDRVVAGVACWVGVKFAAAVVSLIREGMMCVMWIGSSSSVE